jgi:hypothetical protein
LKLHDCQPLQDQWPQHRIQLLSSESPCQKIVYSYITQVTDFGNQKHNTKTAISWAYSAKGTQHIRKCGKSFVCSENQEINRWTANSKLCTETIEHKISLSTQEYRIKWWKT